MHLEEGAPIRLRFPEDPPSQEAMVEWKGGLNFCLHRDFKLEVEGRFIIIPGGFQFDGASVPRFFWAMMSPIDLGVLPVLVHDWLYRTGGNYGLFNRTEADRIFQGHMVEAGVPWTRRIAAYTAVRIFGGSAWRTNQRKWVRREDLQS